MLAGDAARIPDGLIAWIPAEARLPDRERNRARGRSLVEIFLEERQRDEARLREPICFAGTPGTNEWKENNTSGKGMAERERAQIEKEPRTRSRPI